MSSKEIIKAVIVGSDFFTGRHLQLLSDKLDEPETHSYYAEELEPEEFFGAFFSPSLFHDTKLFIIKHAENIKSPEDFLTNVNRAHDVAIIMVSSDSKESATLQKSAKAMGFCVMTESRQNNSTKSVEIKAIFADAGLKIDDSTANRIGVITDWNLITASSEAKKLSIYFAHRAGNITQLEIVANIGSHELAANFDLNFSFLNAFLDRRRQLCMEIYQELTETSAAFYLLTAYIAALYFKLTNQALYSASNPFFNGKDYFMRTVDKSYRNWKSEDAARIISTMAEMDLAVKTGKMDMKDTLLMLINHI